jgi:hypothetical protein
VLEGPQAHSHHRVCACVRAPAGGALTRRFCTPSFRGVDWRVDNETLPESTRNQFVRSHGVRVPTWFWRVIVTLDPVDRIAAWRFPNRPIPRREVNDWAVSLHELEQWLGEPVFFASASNPYGQAALSVPSQLRRLRAPEQWAIPRNCDLR